MEFFKSWGNYPPEYNRAVHGLYDPAIYYGKRDTPLAEVKLGELSAWLGRRNKSPHAMIKACSRAYWRHYHTWHGPKRPGPAGILHYCTWITLMGFILDYPNLKKHKNYRYH